METKHTPEPWGVSVALSGSENDRGFDIFGDYKHIARVSPMIKDSRGNASEEGKANAARIVACVNALAGLNPECVRDVVEALRANVAAFDAINKVTPWSENEPAWWLEWSRCSRLARAALAKLEDVK